MIEHLKQHEDMMSEIKRVLKPDGLIIISSPERKYYSDTAGFQNQFHKKELYLSEFEALLERHFKYRCMLFQKMTFCSLITSASPGNIPAPFVTFRGDDTHVNSDPQAGFPYNIAICSDAEVDNPGFTFSTRTRCSRKFAGKDTGFSTRKPIASATQYSNHSGDYVAFSVPESTPPGTG